MCAACLDNYFKAPNGLCTACDIYDLSVATNFTTLVLVLVALIVVGVLVYYTYQCVQRKCDQWQRQKWHRNKATREKLAEGQYGRRSRYQSLKLLQSRQANFWQTNKNFIVPKVCVATAYALH